MKLLIDYKADSKGFILSIKTDIDIREDAEALGYITHILFESAQRFAELMKSANSKYHPRIASGLAKSVMKQRQENNPHYPFTTFLTIDEKDEE